MGNMTVVGIDLSADEKRASGVCILTNNRVKTLVLHTDEELMALVHKVHPQLIAIDAPLSLPSGRKDIYDKKGEHFRPCDLELMKRGIRFFPITLGGMRKLTERGMNLKRLLKKKGFLAIEVFPGGAQDVLGLPRKQKDLNGLRDGLKKLGLRYIRDDTTHDELDAITCAYVGWLFLQGEAELLGDKRNGIVMPCVYPKEFLEGVKLYWRGYYWHSHECWENLWRKSNEPNRSFLKALIQIDAALIHSHYRHWSGVSNLLARVSQYLLRCPEKVLGIYIPDLFAQIEKFRNEIERILQGRKGDLNWKVKPRILPDNITPPDRERLKRAVKDLPTRLIL